MQMGEDLMSFFIKNKYIRWLIYALAAIWVLSQIKIHKKWLYNHSLPGVYARLDNLEKAKDSKNGI